MLTCAASWISIRALFIVQHHYRLCRPHRPLEGRGSRGPREYPPSHKRHLHCRKSTIKRLSKHIKNLNGEYNEFNSDMRMLFWKVKCVIYRLQYTGQQMAQYYYSTIYYSYLCHFLTLPVYFITHHFDIIFDTDATLQCVLHVAL